MNEYGLWFEEAYSLRVWTAVDGDGTIVELEPLHHLGT